MTAARVLSYPAALTLPAAAGAFVALVLGRHPTSVGVGALCALAVLYALVAWPWASLPAAIVGGTVAAQALGLEGVEPVVLAHLVFVVLGFLAVAVRRALGRDAGGRVATPADVPMLAFAAVVAFGAAHGVVAGNDRHEILVAGYLLGVVPLYFFLATLTLTSGDRLRKAGALFVAAVAALALVEVAQPGRHGGLFAALALPPLLVVAGRARGGQRVLLLAAAALFALDVALASYRAVWLAAALAVGLLAIGRARGVRRTVAVGLTAAAALALAGAALDGGFRERTETVGVAVHEPSGYRLAEARVGLDAFLGRPLFGEGLGQVESGAFLPGLGVAAVGPEYHSLYVMVLANLGLVGIALLAWPLAVALRQRGSHGLDRAFHALLVGFAAAAMFAGPTDGHWELGLLAALTLVAARFESSGSPR